MGTPPIEANEHASWSPALRRAVISVCPDFFALPAEQRLRFRASLPKEDRHAIAAALLRAHGYPETEVLRVQAPDADIPVEFQHQINEWLQPLVGIGMDAFSLNEPFEPGRSIVDFPTLLDYDMDDHQFQERARRDMDASYVQRPYRGALNATWARCLRNGRLCYFAYFSPSRPPISAERGQRFRRTRTPFQAERGQRFNLIPDTPSARK